jgi:autophagy-related protein 9
MRQVVACIHYAPKSWLSNAHCTKVNQEFTQIFRLKMELLLEELLSPVLTPIILYFWSVVGLKFGNPSLT